MKTTVFEFSSRIVKMLYRQFRRSLSGRVGWLDLREKFFLYYIVIFYKIKYIFFQIIEPRARPHARTPDSPFDENTTISPFHDFTFSLLILTLLLFEHFSLTWI